MKNVLLYTALGISTFAAAQQAESPLDSLTKPIQLDEVLVSSVRATHKNPVTFSNLSKKEIKTKNFGQQLPLLLNQLPNVVSYSMDGSGFGSSGMYVRGSDLYRTNVTINGVPLNDSESQGVFFYNLSDFAASAESIQLQRGVGTSSNGAGAFGASLNVLTDAVQEKASGELANFYGSYNTHKHSLKLSTGKLNDRFELSGRFRLSRVMDTATALRLTSSRTSYKVLMPMGVRSSKGLCLAENSVCTLLNMVLTRLLWTLTAVITLLGNIKIP